MLFPIPHSSFDYTRGQGNGSHRAGKYDTSVLTRSTALDPSKSSSEICWTSATSDSSWFGH